MERLAIEKALSDSGNNKTQAAKVLGLSRRGLLKKLERYKLANESAAQEALEDPSEEGSEDEGED